MCVISSAFEETCLTDYKYLHGKFCYERGLVRGMRHKSVMVTIASIAPFTTIGGLIRKFSLSSLSACSLPQGFYFSLKKSQASKDSQSFGDKL